MVFESDPKALVEQLVEMVLKIKKETNLVYNNYDGFGGTGKGDDDTLRNSIVVFSILYLV